VSLFLAGQEDAGCIRTSTTHPNNTWNLRKQKPGTVSHLSLQVPEDAQSPIIREKTFLSQSR
jgi:hypothetical protein